MNNMSIENNDPYMPEIMQETGEMFEIAVGDYSYDIIDFTNKYMNSNIKREIDNRGAYRTTMSGRELLEDFIQHTKNIKKEKHCYDPFIANWIGCFYTALQAKTGLYSSDIIKIVPIEYIKKAAYGLHDLDMNLVMDKICSTRKLKIQR